MDHLNTAVVAGAAKRRAAKYVVRITVDIRAILQRLLRPRQKAHPGSAHQLSIHEYTLFLASVLLPLDFSYRCF